MTDPWYGTLKHPRHTRRERRVAGILAGLTFVTMTMAGVGHGLDYVTLTGRTGTAFDPLTTGAQFAFCLIGILGTHEYGHYLTAVRNGVRTRLPKFIPAPTFAGTLGAFITIHGMERRRAVFDIAAAGPLVGFAVTVPVLAAGILVSTPVPIEAFDEHEMTRLGTPMLMSWIVTLAHGEIAPGMALAWHPVAMAGWLGLLITALNLIPVGFLDGGHITHSMLPSRTADRWKNGISLSLLVGLSVHDPSWSIWTVLVGVMVLAMGRKTPICDPDTPLGTRRQWVAVLLGAIALVSLTPTLIIR